MYESDVLRLEGILQYFINIIYIYIKDNIRKRPKKNLRRLIKFSSKQMSKSFVNKISI